MSEKTRQALVSGALFFSGATQTQAWLSGPIHLLWFIPSFALYFWAANEMDEHWRVKP
jgi:isoprenylcysteine carboxyl methyltransferase (ICMT) family protein YpbQ